jgi:hypothetical protein
MSLEILQERLRRAQAAFLDVHGVCGHQEEHRDELREWRDHGGPGSREG